jgi:hypothetical protein
MAAIPNEDVNKAFAVNSEDAEKKIRAIDTRDPLKKIGSSTNYTGSVNLDELRGFIKGTSSESVDLDGLRGFIKDTSSENVNLDELRSFIKDPSSTLSKPNATSTPGKSALPRPENEAVAKEEPSNEPSFLDNVLDVGTAISEGAQQTLNRIGATGGAYTGNERVVVESAQYAKKLEDESEAVRLKEFKDSLSKIKRIDEKEAGLIDSVFYYVGEVAKTAYDNPAGTVQFVAEQLPNAATVLGAGFAGLKTGAAVGTVVNPGVGTVVGGTLGFIAGMFGGNTLIETGAKAQEKAADGTFTEQERSEAIKEGAVKAGVVTAVDTATLGASKWILGAGSRAVEKATVKTLERFNINASAATKSIETAAKEAADAAKASGLSATQTRINVAEAAQKAAKDSGLLDPLVIRAVKGAQEKAYTATNRLYNRLPRNTAPLALETIGEGAGEYLGELAATGEADILDAVIESLAGTAQSVTELGAIASSATADGKTTRATMNAIVNEELRIEQQQEQDGQRRSDEDKQRQDTVSDLVSSAIDVEKTLSSTEGIKFLVALHNNNSSDGETSNLIKNAAMKAGVGSQFENNLENKDFVEDGQQIISDSPTFAREFMTALSKYVFDPPADTKPKMPTGRVNERQANNQMDEDLMAQEQSGQLFTAPPTDTNLPPLPQAKPDEPSMPIQRGSVSAVPMSLLTTPEALQRTGDVLSVLDKSDPNESLRALNLAAERGGLAEWEARAIAFGSDQPQSPPGGPAVGGNAAIDLDVSDQLYSKTESGRVKAVFFKDLKRVYYSRFAWNTGDAGNTLTSKQFQALELHEIGAHYAVEQMLGKEGYKTLLSDLRKLRSSDQRVDEAYKSVPQNTPEHLVDHEALGYLVENYANMSIVQRFIQMLSDWYQSTFKNKTLTASQIQSITKQAFNKYKKDIDRVFLMQNISSTPTANKVRVDFQNALNANPEAMNFLDFMQQFKDKIMLSGSLALSAQRAVFRPSNQQIHDLDFRVINKDDLQELLSAVAEKYPNSGVSGQFSSRKTQSDVISISLNINDPNALSVDFFTRIDEEPYGSQSVAHSYVDANGNSKSINLLSGQEIFEAKLNMNRVKDVDDAIASESFDVRYSKEGKKPTGAQTAQPRQAMTLRDIGLSQMQDQNVQTAESSREIEEVRGRGAIEAAGDRNFPTARLDKTLKRAEKEPEAMQAARTFVEASERKSAAEKSLNDAITNNANPVERARLTQDAVKAREEYNQAIQNIDIDQTDQTETPSSFQEKGRPEPKSRAETIEQVKENVKAARQKVFDLIASGNLWEAMDEWKLNSLALQKINSQIYLLQQLIDEKSVEISNAETFVANQKEIDKLTKERKALREELNEANNQMFMSQFIFSDMVARELNKNPNNPNAKILGDYVAAAQRKKELIENALSRGKVWPASRYPKSYLEALMMNDPFRVTIRAIIADIYNSNETNHAEAVKSRLDNFDFWVEQASKEYASQGTKSKPFTLAQKNYLKKEMRKKFVTIPNVLASFHSYKNQKDGNYTTNAGAELSKRLDGIINSIKSPKSINEDAYLQIAILERILDGTATPQEIAQYGHLGGYVKRDAKTDSSYQDPSTAEMTKLTLAQHAAAIIKEIRESVRTFNEDISKKYENQQEAIRQLENIDALNMEALWNMSRDQTFHKMQIEYRKAIDAGLNPVEAGKLFNEAMRNFALIYAYKPDVGMISSTSRYDPVLAQIYGDMGARMFPEINGTLDDLAKNVRLEIMESLNEVEQQSPQQILTRLIDELKSNKVDAAYAVKFVNDLLRDKELNLGDIIQSLKAAGVERPIYLASLTSHISLRYSMDYWVSKNGGGQQYADQWLADHHSLNIVQRFKDIKVRDENGVEVQQEDLLELADNEAQAYKEWLGARRDDLEAQNLDIDPDATATSDVLQRFSFYKYTLDTLPEGDSTELINAWHRDIEYALRKYPHLRSEIISTDQDSNALVKGQDALAHRQWIAQIKQSIKQANVKFEGNRKAKAVIADLLERGEITEAEYDIYYDRIAIADANEYQAIIDNIITLANNTGRKDRNRRVKPMAAVSISEDREPSEYEKELERIKQEDLQKSETLNEFAETGVIIDDSVNQLVLDDPSRFASDMTTDEINDVFDAYAAEGRDPYIIEEVGESDLDYVDPNTDARLRQGPYSGVFTAAQTQTWVNNLIGDWNVAPKVHVVSRPSLLPEPVRTRILGKIGANTGAKGAFDTTDGSVYIFSDYVTSEADLEFTVFHEVAGHLGLRGLLGNRLDSFLETAYRTNEKVREMADAMMSKEGITRLEAVEEILSDANTSSEVPSLVTNFVGLVITGLRRIGFNKVADWLAFVTTAEVQYTLNAAKRWAKDGDIKSYNGAPDTIRLSTTPSPYEMFAMKRGKLSGYARYNPLTDEWYVFTSMSGDIRDIANSHARVIADMADVRAELSKFGKIEERKRSSYFRDNKVPVNFMTFPNLMEGSALQSYRNKFVQYVQNEYLPVWKLMDHLQRAGRLSKVMDLRTDLSLYERKTGALVERFTKTYVKQIQFLLEKAGKKGATSEFVNNVMVAYHAEERNKEILHTQLKALYFSNSKLQKETKLVDSNGDPLPSNHQFTFKEYETILKTFKRLKKDKDPAVKADSVNETGSGMGPDKITKPDGTVIPGYKEIFAQLNTSDFAQELREVSELLDKLGDARVDYMVQTGLVSSLDGAKMKSYRHYRNLSGINSDLDNDPTTDAMLDRTGKKFNAAKAKEKRALGRGDIAPDVIARTLAAFESTIIRGQKNLVAQKVLMVFEHNYDPNFIVINEIAKKQKVGPDGVVRIVDDENYLADPSVMVARVGGIPVTMKFKQTGYGSVGEALHGMIYPPQMNNFLYVVGRLNRVIGQLLTTWNPLWVPVNFIRDIQTLYSNAASDGRISRRAARQMFKTTLPAMYTSVYANILDSAPVTEKGKLAKKALLGIFPQPRSDLLASYKEAKFAGGLTSFIDRKGLEEQMIELDRVLNGSFKRPGISGAAVGAIDWTVAKIEGLGKALEFFTIPFEYGPRLAAYHVAKSNMVGMDKSDAAVFSGEITVNFNMRGSTKSLRQLFLFFNPAVQGTAKIVDLAKKDKVKFGELALSWIAFGALMNLVGRALSGEDENGENKIDGLPIYKRSTAAIWMADMPGGAIPIAYGWNFFYSVGTFAMDSIVADVPVSTSAKRIAATGFEAFSPIGLGIADASTAGTAVAKTLSPQVILPLTEYVLNENRFGAPIRMDDSFTDEEKPDTQMAFSSVHPLSKFATDKLHQLTGGNKWTSDGIDINPALVDQMVSGYLPGAIDTAYKELGRYMRQSSGLDVDEGKPNPIVARFTAYRPEMMDAAIFRDAHEEK